jgi:putative Mg2+ transporter-C (MgtC) family protein
MPSQIFAHLTIIFGRNNIMSETEIRELNLQSGFSVANVSYQLREKGEQFECRMTVRTMDRRNVEKLSKSLLGLPSVIEFNISQAGD